MSLDMVINNKNILSTEASTVSLNDTVKSNLQNRKVEVISSGLSTLALAGGIVAASILGGPIGLIIGLAAATFLALGAFLKSILAQPQNVTKLDPSITEQSQVELATVTEQIEVPADKQAEAVAQQPVVENQPVETETVATKEVEEEKQTESAQTETVTVADKETQKPSRLASAASFVKTHKLALGLGAAALATGAGLYYYGAFSAATAATAAAAPTCANVAKASTFTNTCSAASAPMAVLAAAPATCGAAKTLASASVAAAVAAPSAAQILSARPAPTLFHLAKESFLANKCSAASAPLAVQASSASPAAPLAAQITSARRDSSLASLAKDSFLANTCSTASAPSTCPAATVEAPTLAQLAKTNFLGVKKNPSASVNTPARASSLPSSSYKSLPSDLSKFAQTQKEPLPTSSLYDKYAQNRKEALLKFPNRPKTDALAKASRSATTEAFYARVFERAKNS